MVSVNEKYFIENLACENAVKSPQKVLDSKLNCSADDRNQTPESLKLGTFDNKDDTWEEHHGVSDYDVSWINEKSELNLPSSSEVSFPSDYSNCEKSKKRIVWHHQVIDNINNILSKSNLNPSTSISSCKDKKFSLSTNCFHENIEKRGEDDYKHWDDTGWDDPPAVLSQEKSSHYKCRVNKKRFYSRDDNNIFKKSKVKNFSIQPLNANWRYERIDYDEIVVKIKERSIEIKDWVKVHEPKISLIGDSHTRHLADIITEMLTGFKIEDSVKPGAKSQRVLSGIKDVLKHMGENDFLVTLSGTNDMWSETLEEPKTVVYNTVMEARCTNLLLCNVPVNYLEPDDSTVHDNIINFNQFYEDVVSFSKWAHLVNLYQLKDRSFFTRHGLHFNLYGKIKICELVSNKILDIIDLIK